MGENAFQTGWFLESLATQTLVIHIIRTKKIPFIQSRSSLLLLASTFSAVAFAWILPFTPIAELFGLVILPKKILLVLALTVVFYLLTVEIAKRYFYRKQEM
jgi:Mg2+-importing ATPase